MLAATAEYLEGEDALLAWVTECCMRDVQASEGGSSLFASWKEWAMRTGEQVGTQKRFTQSLVKHGFEMARSHTLGRGFRGLRLRPASTETPWKDDEATAA